LEKTKINKRDFERGKSKNSKLAKYVLEINAGKVRKLNIKTGDKLTIL